MKVTTSLGREMDLTDKYFVTATDKMMSGWGRAEGKIAIMKYYVIIGGQKRFCSTKREANEIIIDEFLNGTHGIDFRVYETTGVVCG